VRTEQDDVELPGRTRNLSSKGAFFVVAGAVETGAAIEFFVTLQEDGDKQQETYLRCRGHVIRLEKMIAKDQLGVAATIDRYEFKRSASN
jgi:hypothetical protein